MVLYSFTAEAEAVQSVTDADFTLAIADAAALQDNPLVAISTLPSKEEIARMVELSVQLEQAAARSRMRFTTR